MSKIWIQNPEDSEKYNLANDGTAGNYQANFSFSGGLVFSAKGFAYTEQDADINRALKSAIKLLESDKAIVSVNLDKYGTVSRGWVKFS